MAEIEITTLPVCLSTPKSRNIGVLNVYVYPLSLLGNV
jgi:hypothetical protein